MVRNSLSKLGFVRVVVGRKKYNGPVANLGVNLPALRNTAATGNVPGENEP